MRLIDADNLENFAHEEVFGTEDMIQGWIEECNFGDDIKIDYEDELTELCWKVLEGCMNIIRTEPTAYDVDKVVEQLEEKRKYHSEQAEKELEIFCLEMFHHHNDEACALQDAIEIVKEEVG